ncbi:MAG: alpha/beta hydrolase [Acetatifactor sp.]|nr:alpha/beta hydrolase [Acetatifactor sp.]
MSGTSERIRKNFAETDEKRDAGLTTPETVIRYDDISYGPDPVWQVLDVYRPKAAEKKRLPIIVSVHGGGWVYGDKERYQFYCMSLAEQGFAVVNFSYRLAPEHKFPAALEDTCMVFTWVFEKALRYGLDTENIFAVGDSAGGHTLALFCAMCTNPDYQKRFPFSPPKDFVPSAIALNSGIYMVTVSDKPEDKFSTDLMSDYLENKNSTEELLLVNPIEWMNGKFPPTFLMTAEGDFLKHQVPAVASKLIDENVAFSAHYYKDTGMELGHVFHLNIRLPKAQRCNEEECTFFKKYMKTGTE